MDAISEVIQILDHCGCVGVWVCVCACVSFLSLCIPSSLGNLGQNSSTLSNSKQVIHRTYIPSKFAEIIF